MMIFLSLRVTADAEGGLKIRAHLRPDLQGFGDGQPQTSERRVYTGALLAATLPTVLAVLFNFSFNQSNEFTWTYIKCICYLP